MSEEVIDRVDQLIKKNNIKYKDQQSQKAYEQALKEYEKLAKFQLTKQYASMVKEGNRKAQIKAKEVKTIQEMKKKKNKKAQVPADPTKQKKDETKLQVIKPKLSEVQLQMFNKTVEARAERVLQEQQLQKLTKKLDQEKKRTKLYELNQRCKKMLSKSHERIFPARNVSQSKMEVLKHMEEKAFGEIRELDNMINNLVDQANVAKNTKKNRPQTCLNIETQAEASKPQQDPIFQNEEDYFFPEEEELAKEMQAYEDSYDQIPEGHFNNELSLNTLIFQKSPEELLRMNYIPI